MKSKIKTIFLLFLGVFLISGAAFGATRYLLVAPGETYTGSGAKTGSPNTQVAGFPFILNVYSANDSTWAPVLTLENTNLYATQASTFNPVVPFLLSENNVSPAVSSCKRAVTITVDNAVSGNVIFYATPVVSGGPIYNSVTITVQKINGLLFNAITSPKTAGQEMTITITATMTGGATATGFTGSAASVTISAVYTGQYTVPVAVATFSAGVATARFTLYDATDGGAQRVTLTASITSPSGVPASLSTNFVVNPAAVTKLLLMGPGQSMNPGVNGGNGRTGSSETTDTVAAGVTFSATVYAVDAYWNTVTGATGTVSLASTDPLVTTPSATTLVNGKATLTVRQGTPGNTTLTATSSMGYTSDIDVIPVTYGIVDHFEFTTVITDKTAFELFRVYAVAHDLYHNVVADFNDAVNLQALKGGSTALTSSHWYSEYYNPFFINGYLNGASGVRVRITERTSSCTIRLTYNSIIDTCLPFAVNPSTFAKLLVIAPGESFDPGAGFPADTGKSGVPNSANAGSNVPFTAYGTDAYCNIVTSAGDSFDVSSSDTAGSANPVRVTLAGGVGGFNFQFVTNGSQGVYCNDVTTAGISPASVTVLVQGGAISYFDFTGITGTQTAGTITSPVVRAMDSFNNFINTYSGTAWVSCPDTDWVLPSETTINITPTAATLIGSAWFVTFTGGQAVLSNMSFRRAGTARIFVCDDASGTTYNAIGHSGLSTPITINHGSIIKRLQIVVPGMTPRPGTPDGLDGSPRGQLVGDVFTVTVNACDDYWNKISSGTTGWNDTIRLITSDNGNAQAGATGGALSTPPVTASMTAGPGSVMMDVIYNQEQANFYLEVSDVPRGSVTIHQSPFINIFNVDHFKIRYTNSDTIPGQIVDTYFTVTIQAEDASLNRITSFDGAEVDLRDTGAESDALFTLIPTKVTFTAGFAIVQVKMFKASTTLEGSGVTIRASFGSKFGQSNSFSLWPGNPTYVITKAPGMTHKPGLVQTGLKNYVGGCIGDPLPVKAGDAFTLEVIYCDANFNRIYLYPATTCNLTSSDPLATVGSGPELLLSTGSVFVPVTAGFYQSGSTMKLRTVGPSRSQIIYSAPASGSWTTVFPTKPIPIVHTTHDHFGISAPSAPQVAGVPFNITITARDAYQNICDNGVVAYAVPFNNSVNLLPSTLANTMYPYVYTLSNGVAVASVRLFKAPDANVTIEASYGAITGSSNVIETISNEFKRLLVTDSGYGGMVPINGRFSGAIPGDDSTFPMVTGAPFASDPDQADVSYQSGSNHFAKIHPFTVYACDAYGNITASAELAGNTVTVVFNDVYGQPVTPTTLDVGNGYKDIGLIFHTAKTGMYVTAETTQSGIADYTTPVFDTLAGPAYGLQLLVPGIDAVEGSGRTIGAFSNWYNGVTGIAAAEYTTQPFPVTVQAADIFGNFQSTDNVSNNAIRVYTSATTNINPYPLSHPTNIQNFVGYLNDSSPGRSTLTAMYDVSLARDVDLKPQDFTAPGPSCLERVWIEYPNVPIVMSGNLEYQIIVKGVDYGLDGTNSVTAVALEPFALTVNVVDSVSKKPVYGINAMFKLVPVYAVDTNTATGVTLSVPLGGSGSVSNGVFTTVLELYNRADLIRIRVEDPSAVPVVTTGPRLSCIIDFGANSLSASMTAVAVPSAIGSGQVSQIRAQVIDAGGNSVSGREVEFEFLNTDPESTGTGGFGSLATPLLITRTATNLQGVAVANFYGGYINGRCKIVARYYGAGAPQERTVYVSVSLVDPNVSRISNYPNPFAAGAENTNISFYVATPVAVDLKIYNLVGQLVLEKTYTQAETAALIISSGNMISYIWDGKNEKGKVVGNGGYIAAIEAGTARYKRKIAVRK